MLSIFNSLIYAGYHFIPLAYNALLSISLSFKALFKSPAFVPEASNIAQDWAQDTS